MDAPLVARRRCLESSAAHGDVPRRVNDVHSGLNRTLVADILRPRTISELRHVVQSAAGAGTRLSFCGARHAMGGQQFAAGVPLIDMTSLHRVVDIDAERGLVTVEAGIEWVSLVHHLLRAFPDQQNAWGIIQKQTGADRLTVGGALAANIHGRGLRLRPIIGDVESFEIVNAAGDLINCSRTENPRLFALAIGGYGLFGPIARVTLRLAHRHKVQRRVRIACVDDLPALVDMRIGEGYEYGDFQFAIDPGSQEFLRAGVFSCYRHAPADISIPDDQRVLSSHEWRRLLRLAHTAKSQAFAEYARYYMATDGQYYWSDTHQFSEYPEAYHDRLDKELGAEVRGSEMISELYVPRPLLPQFMTAVRESARRHDFNVIYGTIRVIEQDNESVLAWARERWACVVFNLHVDHSPAGIDKAAADFRHLIDRAAELGGSYYLTYHRWATADQVAACHPRMREFLDEKRRLDPRGVFTSDWYAHHVRLLGAG